MTPLLSLVLLILFAYLGALFYKKVNFHAKWIQGLTYTGSLYLILGYVIGPEALNVITPDISNKLEVIYALTLGWVGFLIGLQTNIKSLKRFQLKYYLYSGTIFFVTLFLLQFFLVVIFFILNIRISHLELLILSTAGAVTSPTMIAVFLKGKKISGLLTYLLRFIPAFDNILGVILLGFIMAISGNVIFLEKYNIGFFIIIIEIIIALLSAWLYTRLIKKIKTDQEKLLYIFGFIFLNIGIAIYLHQSVLFSTFIFGFGLANFDKGKKVLYLMIQNLEKHLYILLMIFAGVNLTLNFSYLLFLIIFLVFHIIAKYIGGLSGNRLFERYLHTKDEIGLGNLAMGGLSLAIILDYHLKDTMEMSHILLFVAVISIILNDIISYNLLERYFNNTTEEE